MDAEIIVELLSQSSKNDIQKGAYVFEDSDTWVSRFFRPDVLNNATAQLESQIKRTIEELRQMCEGLEQDDEVVTQEERELLHESKLNKEMQQALNDLWVIRAGIQDATALKELGELSQSLSSLETVSAKVKLFEVSYPQTRIVNDITAKITDLTQHNIKLVDDAWAEAIQIQLTNESLTFTVKQSANQMSLESIFEVVQLSDLEKRCTRREVLLQTLDETIWRAVLKLEVNRAEVQGDQLILSKGGMPSLAQLRQVLEQMIEFLNDSFASTDFVSSIATRFGPMLIQKLTSRSIPLLFPSDASKIDRFEMELHEFAGFEDFLVENGWTKGEDLRHWIMAFRDEWIFNRRLVYLDQIRNEIVGDADTIRVSLQAEARIPQENTESIEPPAAVDDWNSNWSDDDDKSQNKQKRADGKGDDWDDDEGDEWDEWDDGGDDGGVDARGGGMQGQVKPSNTERFSSAHNPLAPSFEFTCTKNVDIIVHNLESFARDVKDETIITRQVGDLLALYRALTPITYVHPILLYNDIVRLLGLLPVYVPEGEREALRRHGDRCLSELVQQKQSQILDALSVANGFVNCNPRQNLRNCQSAIKASMKVIRDAADDLSSDAALPLVRQILGQLVEDLVNAIMINIESQEDISEAECNELSTLIEQVSELDTLFEEADAGLAPEERTSLAAAHVPSWIKFQFFGEILQSKIVDIMYLFNSGSLSDYSATELIGMLRSLFAESDYRKRAIANVLKGPQGVDE